MLISRKQEAEYKKGFINSILYGEEAYEVSEDDFYRCLSIEEMEKLKEDTEGEWLKLFP